MTVGSPMLPPLATEMNSGGCWVVLDSLAEPGKQQLLAITMTSLILQHRRCW